MLDITNNNSAASGQTITNNNSVRLHLLPVPAVRLLHSIESHLAAQPQALQDSQAFTCCPVSALLWFIGTRLDFLWGMLCEAHGGLFWDVSCCLVCNGKRCAHRHSAAVSASHR